MLVGWMFDVGDLRNVGTGLVSMKPNTAFALLALSAALWLLRERRPTVRRTCVVRAAAAFAAGIAGLTICEYVFGWKLGIDELVFREQTNAVRTVFPGRMALSTAICIALSAASLVLLSARRYRSGQSTAWAVVFLGGIAAVGYLYGVEALYRHGQFSTVSIHTALALIVLNVGALMVRPNLGPMALLTGGGAAGTVMRRLLPEILVVPVVVGALSLAGEEAGMYGPRFAVAVVAASLVLIWSFLIWRGARALHDIDVARMQAEGSLRRANRELEHRAEARKIQMLESEVRYRTIVELAGEGIWQVDAEGLTTFATERMAAMLGYGADEMLGRSAFDFMDEDDRVMVQEKLERRRRGISEDYDLRLRKHDGTLIWAHLSTTPIFDGDGNGDEYCGALALVTDVTTRHEAEAKVAATEALYRAALNASADAFVILQCVRNEQATIVDFRFVELNRPAERELNRRRDDVLGTLLSASVPVGSERVINRYLTIVERQESIDEDVLMATDPSDPRWIHQRVVPLVDGVAITTTDVTEAKRIRDRIEYQAHHDELTDLPNRAMLEELGDQSLARTRRAGTTLAVLFIDLDDFKQINDDIGHYAGDAVLVEAAARFRSCLRTGDVIARVGGDEFIVTCEPVADGQATREIAERLIASLDEPVIVGSEQIMSSASIGVALDSSGEGTLASLVREADGAMYLAKERGRHQVVVFDPVLMRPHRSRSSAVASGR